MFNNSILFTIINKQKTKFFKLYLGKTILFNIVKVIKIIILVWKPFNESCYL